LEPSFRLLFLIDQLHLINQTLISQLVVVVHQILIVFVVLLDLEDLLNVVFSYLFQIKHIFVNVEINEVFILDAILFAQTREYLLFTSVFALDLYFI